MNEVNEVKKAYLNKLKNNLYALLCERENNGEWEKFLDSILIELYGWDEEDKTINYLRLIYKLNECKVMDFQHFRTTIFDCMSLISKTI